MYSLFLALYQGNKDVFKTHGIPLSNCVSLGFDNTNSNVGCRNSLKTKITADNPSVYVAGCVCHILHNPGKKEERYSRYYSLECSDFKLDNHELLSWFSEEERSS